MTGELEHMPLQDILAAVGYKTATGGWPPGFDVAHAILTLISVTDRLRLSLHEHHSVGALDGAAIGEPCPICMKANGVVRPSHVITVDPPDSDGIRLVHCECGWQDPVPDVESGLSSAADHLATVGTDPRDG